MSEDTKVNIKTKEIVLPKVDLTPYVGKKAKVKDAGVYAGMHGHYAKFETDVLGVVEGGKEPIEIRASSIFGLHMDKDGQLGWGKETKLGQFLAKYGAKDIESMIGKEVLIQIKPNKEGTEFLNLI